MKSHGQTFFLGNKDALTFFENPIDLVVKNNLHFIITKVFSKVNLKFSISFTGSHNISFSDNIFIFSCIQLEDIHACENVGGNLIVDLSKIFEQHSGLSQKALFLVGGGFTTKRLYVLFLD